jgi:hypothetical protein
MVNPALKSVVFALTVVFVCQACGDDVGVEPDSCGPFPTFEAGLTPAGEIHVSPAGDDDAGDGSQANPYATIRRGVQDAVPGSAVRIHPGTYAGGTFIESLRGTPTAPIWIGGVAGAARPLIDGGGEGLHLSRVSYLIVHDIEVAGSANNGVNADDGGDVDDTGATRNVVFRDLFIHDVGGSGNQDCLKLSGINRYWVLDSRFERCGGGGSGSGVDHVGAHDGLLAGNTFREMSGNAVQVKGGSENVEIRGNHIVDGGARALNMGGSTGDPYFRPPLSTGSPNFEARDIRAVANIIEGATAAIAFVGCVDCLAANNTIVDPGNWIFRILQETTTHDGYEFLAASDGHVVNNLVYFERAALSTDVNVGPNTDSESFRFENNLWYAWDDPEQSAPALPGTEVGSIVGEDPGFTSDYRIDASSPAVGAGVPVIGVASDFDGVCYLVPPSIGAHEIF